VGGHLLMAIHSKAVCRVASLTVIWCTIQGSLMKVSEDYPWSLMYKKGAFFKAPF